MVGDDDYRQINAELFRSTKRVRIDGRRVKSHYKPSVKVRSTDGAELLEGSAAPVEGLSAESGNPSSLSSERSTEGRRKGKRRDGPTRQE